MMKIIFSIIIGTLVFILYNCKTTENFSSGTQVQMLTSTPYYNWYDYMTHAKRYFSSYLPYQRPYLPYQRPYLPYQRPHYLNTLHYNTPYYNRSRYNMLHYNLPYYRNMIY